MIIIFFPSPMIMNQNIINRNCIENEALVSTVDFRVQSAHSGVHLNVGKGLIDVSFSASQGAQETAICNKPLRKLILTVLSISLFFAHVSHVKRTACFCLLTGLNMVELASLDMVVDRLQHG